DACIANVLRIALRYGNLDTLEEGYGINLLPLATFAMETYPELKGDIFSPRIKYSRRVYSDTELDIIAKMHKAISVIQWKLEGQLIKAHPEYAMDDRLLLHRINYTDGTIKLADGKSYPLSDCDFPTIDRTAPYELTKQEAALMKSLHHSFVDSEKLRKHVYCLLRHGSFYLARNNNLMYHASIPLEADGEFRKVNVLGKQFAGRELLDRLDELVQIACRIGSDDPERASSVDYMWYLWCGPDSPLFGKDLMATFERYFIDDKATHAEGKGHYYDLIDDPAICDKILTEFGLPAKVSHIINGHVPVKTIKGENPVKADGKLLVIDGGFSKAYQSTTGIAGYTLVYHSRGFQLVQHEPFESRKKAIEEGQDIISNTVLNEFKARRLQVRDTDKGKELINQVNELNKLLAAYRRGLIREHV
ncbi:MAG: fructose-1,6-bisphosphatase, partial [Muribaculaceae bacterium]|nr:fructose-1,6-bisphosphatase [Muribaculaceae bacterium]